MVRFISVISIIILISINIQSCDYERIPKLTIIDVDHITTSSFVVTGLLEGGVYNHYDFIISNSKIEIANGRVVTAYDIIEKDGLKGYFYNLNSNTNYYVSLFAVINNDTIFSEIMQVKTNEILEFIDIRDGIEYEYVSIGDQQWLAENMKFYMDNALIQNNDSIANHYLGRLYLWQNSQNICPEGWRLPTDEDWKKLERFIGMENDLIHLFNRPYNDRSGLPLLSLKSETYYGMESTNEFGFNAIMSGFYDGVSFENLNGASYYWVADSVKTETGYTKLYRRLSDQGNLARLEVDLSTSNPMMSVRCVRDN